VYGPNREEFMSTEPEIENGTVPSRQPLLRRETILPSSDRGRLAAIVATCSLAGLAGGMALSMVAETQRAVQATRDPGYLRLRTIDHEPVTWLGVRIVDAVPGECAGVRIREVSAGSPASRQGFQTGDYILTFGGDRICSDDHLVDVVRASTIGATPAVGVRRGAQYLVLHPRLANMPRAIRATLPASLR
jgi:hypothetical protein